MQDALGFIEALEQKSTAPAVVDAMGRVLGQFGVEKILIGGLSELDFAGDVFATCWPTGFLDLYIRNDYIRFDPVARRCRRSPQPFEWRTSDFHDEGEPRAVEVMRRGADYGMAHGFMVPIHGPDGFEACVAMSGDHLDLTIQSKPTMHLIAQYACARVRGLVGRDAAKPRAAAREQAKPVLTSREQEVLAWVASGKSAWEIGEILNIAKRTVDEHAQTAFRKLGAVNRTHAVAIALRDRIIAM
jgi:LuxR family transcriptional regulator, quorum-sensing system regulator BjaR1